MDQMELPQQPAGQVLPTLVPVAPLQTSTSGNQPTTTTTSTSTPLTTTITTSLPDPFHQQQQQQQQQHDGSGMMTMMMGQTAYRSPEDELEAQQEAMLQPDPSLSYTSAKTVCPFLSWGIAVPFEELAHYSEAFFFQSVSLHPPMPATIIQQSSLPPPPTDQGGLETTTVDGTTTTTMESSQQQQQTMTREVAVPPCIPDVTTKWPVASPVLLRVGDCVLHFDTGRRPAWITAIQGTKQRKTGRYQDLRLHLHFARMPEEVSMDRVVQAEQVFATSIGNPSLAAARRDGLVSRTNSWGTAAVNRVLFPMALVGVAPNSIIQAHTQVIAQRLRDVISERDRARKVQPVAAASKIMQTKPVDIARLLRTGQANAPVDMSSSSTTGELLMASSSMEEPVLKRKKRRSSNTTTRKSSQGGDDEEYSEEQGQQQGQQQQEGAVDVSGEVGEGADFMQMAADAQNPTTSTTPKRATRGRPSKQTQLQRTPDVLTPATTTTTTQQGGELPAASFLLSTTMGEPEKMEQMMALITNQGAQIKELKDQLAKVTQQFDQMSKEAHEHEYSMLQMVCTTLGKPNPLDLQQQQQPQNITQQQQ